jgi:MtfA peptidase
MIEAYVIFYAVMAFAMLSLTEFRDKVRVFAQKYLAGEEKTTFKVNSKYHEILSGFRYYDNLSHKGKLKFSGRVGEFIKSKKFIGMEGLQVSEEMKVLISASAIQLTFGLEKYLLESCSVIKVYPRYFFSKLLNAELKGGASESGILMLSWEDFLDGYKDPHDNYNLGLHEMAHVLKINVLRGDNFDDKFSFYLDEWLRIGSSEFRKIKKRDKSLLREYAGTNKHEFFAVCVEHFFESPEEFEKQLPDIYNHLCFLLNQDPKNSETDYILRPDFKEVVNKNKARIPIPQKIKENYKYHGWHWTYSVMLAGIFAGITITLVLSELTIMPVIHLFLFGLSGMFLAFLLQFRFLVKKNKIFKVGDFFLYAVFGIMPIFSGLILLSNFLIRTNYTYEAYEVISHEHRSGEVVVQLRGDAYSDYPGIRTLPSKRFDNSPGNRVLKIQIAEGVFGYHFLVKNEVIISPAKKGKTPAKEETMLKDNPVNFY